MSQKLFISPSKIFVALYLVKLLQVDTAPSRLNGAHSVKKRHIIQMCQLISSHTNRGCVEYNNYGCFCGLGNTAADPVDEVDRCCKQHDQCYGEVSCLWFYPQLVGYSFECETPTLCICTDSPLFARCAYSTCQCDLQLAQCLAKNDYNRTFSHYDRSRCSSENKK